MGLAMYSPPLDTYGNSVRGVKFSEAIVDDFQWVKFNLKSRVFGFTNPELFPAKFFETCILTSQAPPPRKIWEIRKELKKFSFGPPIFFCSLTLRIFFYIFFKFYLRFKFFNCLDSIWCQPESTVRNALPRGGYDIMNQGTNDDILRDNPSKLPFPL